ncbi:hypothetical protein H7J93_02155 [Mycobacterium barrassiae]|uniref:hypothetical protein n=1 Tax=Mycobacterium barrassiae TaxID=319709 RepID=UPI00226590D7|nr:hypothetical protein [Mycobacterium barrassiae]MCV7298437.1 hypothetical protein [Mycobacterium barrassiae]
MSASGGANTRVGSTKDAEQETNSDTKSEDSDKKSESSDEQTDDSAASSDAAGPTSEEPADEAPATEDPAYEDFAVSQDVVDDVEIPEIPAEPEPSGSDHTPDTTVIERPGAEVADNDSRPAAQPTYESPVQNEPAPETKLDRTPRR